MFRNTHAFSGFSVDDIARVKPFYADTLGLDVEEADGMLRLRIAGSTPILVYPKGKGHVAATYTILNFPVSDLDAAVDELIRRGIRFEQYDNEWITTDDRGISRDEGMAIAWFKDPAGNILSVLEDEG